MPFAGGLVAVLAGAVGEILKCPAGDRLAMRQRDRDDAPHLTLMQGSAQLQRLQMPFPQVVGVPPVVLLEPFTDRGELAFLDELEDRFDERLRG